MDHRSRGGGGVGTAATPGSLSAVNRRLRRLIRAFAATAVLLLVAVACSSSGHPTGYDDQADPETGISNVEMNWMEGCEVGFSEDLAQEANDICACSYRRIKADIPFETFVELNDRLKSDPTALRARAETPGSAEAAVVDIVSRCIAES